MLVCVAIAGGLGLWQLDAWSQHRADAARDLEHKPAVPLSRLMSGDSPFPGRSAGQPVSFSGEWTGGNLYVADREHDGRRGYWVVTALEVDGTRSAMPVVRGWTPTTDLAAPTGQASVTGWLEASEATDDVDADPQDDVIPSMRVASIVEHVDADLYSGYVVAKDIPTQDGLAYVEPAKRPGVSTFTGLRNLFYAVEWWLFGGFAVFIWLRWCHDQLHPPEVADPDDEAVPDEGATDGQAPEESTKVAPT
jgi:cytochrome oxidase assembly protein ShyY1